MATLNPCIALTIHSASASATKLQRRFSSSSSHGYSFREICSTSLPRAPHPVTAMSSFDLSPPPIDHDPLENMITAGAKDLDDNITETFGNDDLAIDEALTGVALLGMTGFSFYTIKLLQILFLLQRERDVTPSLLLQLPGLLTLPMLGLQYIFFADKVEIHDITSETCFFVLVGPKSNQVMKALKLDDLIGQPYGTHRHYTVNGMPVTIGVGSVLSRDGFSFLFSPSSSREVWKSLLGLGAVPIGANACERLRVLQGRPAPGKELTKDFNVLEAGLWEAVSLEKGCYKGQETISRLITYGGVKQKLWGIQLSGPTESGTSITTVEDGKKVGVLTSYSVGREGEHFGLGYVKKQVYSGGQVYIGNVLGTLVQVPFLSYPPS